MEKRMLTFRWQFRKLCDESGSMLIELIISLTFLTVAIGAIMSIYVGAQFSLRHTSIEGNALTLADRQMESYKTVAYSGIVLDAATIPGGSDPYVNAHSIDATIPPVGGQITGGSASGGCTSPAQAQPACATQTWTGPDGRVYRIDSYITSDLPPSGGRPVKRVTIIVRRVLSGVVSDRIWGRATSVFDAANPPHAPETPVFP
jgi:type II secretory pathway pseudopilin PulG